jgi:hypothetical protein
MAKRSLTSNYSSDEDGDPVDNYSSNDDDSALSSEPSSSVPESPSYSYGEVIEYDKEEEEEEDETYNSDEYDEESFDEDDEVTEEVKKKNRAKMAAAAQAKRALTHQAKLIIRRYLIFSTEILPIPDLATKTCNLLTITETARYAPVRFLSSVLPSHSPLANMFRELRDRQVQHPRH